MRLQQRDAAAGHDALGKSRTRGVQRVFIESLALFHFRFGRGADFHLRHAAGQLGQAFLQLLAVVFAVGLGDLAADHLDAAFDGLLVARAFGDRRILGVDLDLLGPAQIAQLNAVELDAEVLEDRLAAGQRGNVFEHGLATVAVARRLDRTDAGGCP